MCQRSHWSIIWPRAVRTISSTLVRPLPPYPNVDKRGRGNEPAFSKPTTRRKKRQNRSDCCVSLVVERQSCVLLQRYTWIGNSLATITCATVWTPAQQGADWVADRQQADLRCRWHSSERLFGKATGAIELSPPTGALQGGVLSVVSMTAPSHQLPMVAVPKPGGVGVGVGIGEPCCPCRAPMAPMQPQTQV